MGYQSVSISPRVGWGGELWEEVSQNNYTRLTRIAVRLRLLSDVREIHRGLPQSVSIVIPGVGGGGLWQGFSQNNYQAYEHILDGVEMYCI